MKKIEKEIDLGGKILKLSMGDIALQATSAVMATYGETVVLATVVSAPLKMDPGYFPLSVEYQERLYAGGRIKGSRWVKREGRPTDEEILSGRLIDRGIRPLFHDGYKKDVQVTATVMSVDLENPPDIVSAIAVSAAINASSLPWQGPLVTARIGRKEGKFILNPTYAQLQESDFDLVVSLTKNAVVMVEAGAKEIPEKDIVDAIEFAQKECGILLKLIEDISEEVGAKKEEIPVVENTSKIENQLAKLTKSTLDKVLKDLANRDIGYAEFDEYKAGILDSFEDSEKLLASKVFESFVRENIRKNLISGKRVDGRKLDELRKLSARTGVLPRTHGSAIFERGQTQVLSVATLGAPSLEQIIESAEGEETKRYMHHYSMPPYSVGEVGKMGYPSRREVGHGALAERAIMPVLPSDDKFPYAIRIVSEVLSSNGSTSMASTCGSTLALMDAGVPITSPVAGIAMGLVVDSEKDFAVLTDITGLEDGNGDMDFKVAGTQKGITALQLDVKTLKLTVNILAKALEQAKTARGEILKVILSAIDKPRESVSVHAPKIKVIKVPTEKIGEVIGPGGRVIRKIIAETGAMVEVEDDGTVNISGLTDEEVAAASQQVELLTKEVAPGEIYEGEVKRIESFGAFIEILPGRDGMVHVSQMGEEFIKDPRDVVKIGDKVQVRVAEIDDLGRINLSMILDPVRAEELKNQRNQRTDSGPRRFERRMGYSGRNNRNRDFQPRSNDSRERRSSGPHFPASRYIEEEKKKRY